MSDRSKGSREPVVLFLGAGDVPEHVGSCRVVAASSLDEVERVLAAQRVTALVYEDGWTGVEEGLGFSEIAARFPDVVPLVLSNDPDEGRISVLERAAELGEDVDHGRITMEGIVGHEVRIPGESYGRAQRDSDMHIMIGDTLTDIAELLASMRA